MWAHFTDERVVSEPRIEQSSMKARGCSLNSVKANPPGSMVVSASPDVPQCVPVPTTCLALPPWTFSRTWKLPSQETSPWGHRGSRGLHECAEFLSWALSYVCGQQHSAEHPQIPFQVGWSRGSPLVPPPTVEASQAPSFGLWLSEPQWAVSTRGHHPVSLRTFLKLPRGSAGRDRWIGPSSQGTVSLCVGVCSKMVLGPVCPG